MGKTSRTEALAQEFRIKYELFLNGCDSVEEQGLWDKEEDGEMDAFYQNDLVSVILRLIAADGVVSQRETEYLNDTFGFSYDKRELEEVLACCGEEIGKSFDPQFKNGVSRLREINGKLAGAYAELLELICDIIAESDGMVTIEEAGEIIKLKKLLS